MILINFGASPDVRCVSIFAKTKMSEIEWQLQTIDIKHIDQYWE